jgi:hypothetical protein
VSTSISRKTQLYKIIFVVEAMNYKEQLGTIRYSTRFSLDTSTVWQSREVLLKGKAQYS